MREAELKHARFCMMAVAGWVAVDSGLRFPGEMFAKIPNSFAAHDAAVDNGTMGFLLQIVAICELATGAALFDQAKVIGNYNIVNILSRISYKIVHIHVDVNYKTNRFVVVVVLLKCKGSGREPGDFSFDPLKLGKSPATLARYKQVSFIFLF